MITIPAPANKASLYTGAIFYGVATVALILTITGGLFQLYTISKISDTLHQVNGSTETLKKIAKINETNGNLLVECTTPPSERHPPKRVDVGDQGDCYNRNQLATGQAVSQVSTISIAAAACGAANPGNVAATEACVSKALKLKK